MSKLLYILTGPPGGGKTTAAKEHLPTIPVFDTDLGNKAEWKYEGSSAILMTAAPKSQSKAYWIEEAARFGFIPVLIVCDPGRALAVRRMLARSGKHPSQRNRISRSVQRWYTEYSRHREEIKVKDVPWQELSSSSHEA